MVCPMSSEPKTRHSHPDDIDWDELRSQAREMTTRSYAPYSGFHVGAAAMTTSGRVVRGCNVENVSYGLALCAECGLVSDAVQHAAGKIVALSVVSGSGEFCTPCGRCRQILVEHSTADAVIETAEGPILISALLPGHFDSTRMHDG